MPIDMDALLEASLPSIIEGMKTKITTQISWELESKAAEAVSKHIQSWIEQNVLPAINEQLMESKEGLIAAGAAMGPMIVEALTAAMLDDLKKKLESDYKRREIYKVMFGY